MSEQPGRYQRSTAGMVGAMIVALLAVGAFVGFRALIRTEPDVQVPTVDYQQAMEYGQDQVDFPLVVPQSLPDGWRATSVRVVPQPPRSHLGMLTDQDRYVGLEQSRGSVDKMVETYVDQEAVEGEPVQVAGETWQTWTDEGGDTALTRVEDDVTTLVVGTPGLEVLVDFVESLR